MRLLHLAAASALVFASAACSDNTPSQTVDPNAAVLSFAVIGCNRVDAKDTLGNASTANIEQLNRTFTEIANMNPRPDLVFFAGDLVLGYTADTVLLDKQLREWRKLYEQSALAATTTELVALPGNHEVQNNVKIAYDAGERTWLRVMAPYIKRGGNGPKAGGADKLTTDQSALTYSFTFKGSHFVTVDTDPVGNDWHVPTNWINSDLSAARASGVAHSFVIGHKPAYPYPTVPLDGLTFDLTARDAYWAALNANHVEAMYSAHNHVYYRVQPAVGKTWQVIAGNGGSKLEAKIDSSIPSSGSYYGFTVTTVTNGGAVFVKSYGRDIPAASYTAASTAAQFPTSVRDSFDIAWRP